MPCILFARKSLPYINGTSILHYVILFIATNQFVRERSIKHFCWKCIRLVLHFPRFVWALSLFANHKALFTTTTFAFTFSRETVICLLHFIQGAAVFWHHKVTIQVTVINIFLISSQCLLREQLLNLLFLIPSLTQHF